MLDITFYKKQNNDNYTPCTIELCDEDYEKLIILNFAKSFHLEKQCLIVEEEEYSIDAVYCNALVLKDAKEICNRLLLEELEKVKKYCMRIEGETIGKNKLNFMFVLRDVLSNLDECQYFSYAWNRESCMIVKYKGEKLRYIKDFHGKEVLWILKPKQVGMLGMTFVGGYPDEYCIFIDKLSLEEQEDIRKQLI